MFLKHAWLHTGLMNNMEKLYAPGPSVSQSPSHSPELIRSEILSTHNRWLQHAGKQQQQQHKQKPENCSTVYGPNRWNKSFVTHIRTMLAGKCVFCVFLKWQSFSFCRNDSNYNNLLCFPEWMTKGEGVLVKLIFLFLFQYRPSAPPNQLNALWVNAVRHSGHAHLTIK